MLVLKQLRRKHKLTQKQLSTLSGLSVSLISRTENNKRILSAAEEKRFQLVFQNLDRENAKTGQAGSANKKVIIPGKYTAYTDGGCAINPGGPGGIGCIIINQDTSEIIRISKGFYATTNNRMEISAAIFALREIPAGSSVILVSDSQYLINTMTRCWSRKKNHDLWKELDQAAEGKNISWKWVRGHNGDKYNEACDALATEGINSPDKMDDTGYRSGPNEKPRTAHQALSAGKMGGAMGIPIDVPDVLPLNASFSINPACRQAIKTFQRSRKTFRDYMAVKTGGRDDWSDVNIQTLINLAGPETCNMIRKYLSELKDIAACIRWLGRGLSLKDSIRKILVDKEVSANYLSL